MKNAFAFDISLPAPMPIHEYTVGPDIRNHMSLFAGLTVIVKVRLLPLSPLSPVYIQVEALVLVLCLSTRSIDGSGVADTVFDIAGSFLSVSRRLRIVVHTYHPRQLVPRSSRARACCAKRKTVENTLHKSRCLRKNGQEQ
jgi:hypothetical protein